MLSVSPELLGVSILPVGAARGSLLHGFVSTLVHASGLLAGGGEATKLSVLVLGADNPVNARISSDGLVLRVNQDDLKELKASVLAHPVGVKHAHVAALAGNALFSDRLVSTGSLELADGTGVSGLTIDTTLGSILLTSTSADANAIDDITLLGLVSNTPCFLRARGACAVVNDGKLAVFPGADSHDESADIALLLSPEFFEVFVCSHLIFNNVKTFEL